MPESKGTSVGDRVATVDRMTTSTEILGVLCAQKPSDHKGDENKQTKKLLRDVTKLHPIRKSKIRRKQKKALSGKVLTIDTSRAKSSCDVVRLAIRELKWREVRLCN